MTREARLETDFIALYRGQTVAGARIVAITADPEIVHRLFCELAGDSEPSVGAHRPRRDENILSIVRGNEE